MAVTIQEQIIKILEHLPTKKIELNRYDFLLKEGQIEKYLYFVESGAIRIYIEIEEEEQIIRFGYKGSIITSLTSFIKDTPSVLYIQAIKKSVVWAIKKQDFRDLTRAQEQINTLWLKSLEELTVQQLEREIDILTPSPTKRYQRVLARSPQLFQEIPNKYIASYLRMTPETLSRIKKNF